METTIKKSGTLSTLAFKIDLIVWKRADAFSILPASNPFKIDLIVWKQL